MSKAMQVLGIAGVTCLVGYIASHDGWSIGGLAAFGICAIVLVWAGFHNLTKFLRGQ